MGDVQRIMYVHVPTAWNTMLVLTFAFGCAARLAAARRLGRGTRGSRRRSRRASCSPALVCMQGSIWARPTWGVWWDWDPRLTTTAVLVFAFGGILALRQFVDDPVKRAVWSAVAVVIAYVDVPLVYFSVRWWNSLHQVQSTPADGVARVPLAAAHQRLRRAVPDDRRSIELRARLALLAPRGGDARRLPPSAVARSQREARDDRRHHRRAGSTSRAAYVVSAVILLGYAFSVIWRYRRERSRRRGAR